MVTGLDAPKSRSKTFQAGVKAFQGVNISALVIGVNSFAVTPAMDATFNVHGRMSIEEVGVSQFKDGKITLEQFSC